MVGVSDGAFVDGELEGAIVGLIEGDDYQGLRRQVRVRSIRERNNEK